jgi:hypothetical protein
MTNNMKHVIMKRRGSLKCQAEGKSENEILDTIFKTFDKYEDHPLFNQVVFLIKSTVDNAKQNWDVKALYEYNIQKMIEEEIIDTLAEDGDEIIAEVCNELGVEVDESYYGKLYDHVFVRYTGKMH